MHECRKRIEMLEIRIDGIVRNLLARRAAFPFFFIDDANLLQEFDFSVRRLWPNLRPARELDGCERFFRVENEKSQYFPSYRASEQLFEEIMCLSHIRSEGIVSSASFCEQFFVIPYNRKSPPAKEAIFFLTYATLCAARSRGQHLRHRCQMGTSYFIVTFAPAASNFVLSPLLAEYCCIRHLGAVVSK